MTSDTAAAHLERAADKIASARKDLEGIQMIGNQDLEIRNQLSKAELWMRSIANHERATRAGQSGKSRRF